MMRTNVCLTAVLATILLMGLSACGLKGDLYLTESEQADESPSGEPELSDGESEEARTIEPSATEQSGGSGAGLVTEDSAQAAFDADTESAESDEDQNKQPDTAAPAP